MSALGDPRVGDRVGARVAGDLAAAGLERGEEDRDAEEPEDRCS